MNDLLEKLEEKINETERIATRAAQAHKGASTWTFARGNEDVEPAVFIGERSLYSDWHGIDYLMPSEIEHIAHNDPARILRRVARDRQLIELAKVLREDYQDNAADHLIRLLAEDYEIEVGS